ncbi:MAG: acetyl-CoA carboxylase biotin carboxylase subunit [candidate division Zixibacteria bacterium]|nr:acetyl-CoA carboxylase biotin carboxylase subunit [candidate division Zixibacteria bacterium]
MTTPITKILVANRGEIAIRVIRACRDAKITSVAIYSGCDDTAYHVRLADEAYWVGPAPSRDSYLNQRRIIEVAKISGAQAIHPGYGFLAENAAFAKLCEDSGIIFIGPKSETIALLGDKLEARRTAIKAGLPVVPGTDFDITDMSQVKQNAQEIGFPILVKAAAGGGGKGMRVVRADDPLEESIASAVREAGSAFGDGRVYFERYLERPRHVEIQILADMHGNAIHLGERECSVQRRHQKVIEESPSPIMTEELRSRMGKAAVDIVKESGYIGAGTVEFLVDQDRSFYFLEVNTRLQVEHPVTEMVTGIDIVREQFRIAEGQELSFRQEDVRPYGHAIECRIYAEDPHQDFMPSTGTITEYREPAGPGIRIDSGVLSGSEIPIYYDPIIAKLVIWGRTREEAMERTLRAVMEYRISGVHTTLDFACAVMRSRGFILGDYATDFIDREFPKRDFVCRDATVEERAAIAAILYEHLSRHKVTTTMARTPQDDSGWKAYHRARGVRRLNGGR